ncbi:MAG: hypothetical protein GY811_24540, partial [Myxococcales bacterium]|nr:hypothetical protein [Myxococcales bacterium]
TAGFTVANAESDLLFFLRGWGTVIFTTAAAIVAWVATVGDGASACSLRSNGESEKCG